MKEDSSALRENPNTWRISDFPESVAISKSPVSPFVLELDEPAGETGVHPVIIAESKNWGN